MSEPCMFGCGFNVNTSDLDKELLVARPTHEIRRLARTRQVGVWLDRNTAICKNGPKRRFAHRGFGVDVVSMSPCGGVAAILCLDPFDECIANEGVRAKLGSVSIHAPVFSCHVRSLSSKVGFAGRTILLQTSTQNAVRTADSTDSPRSLAHCKLDG